MDLLKALVPLTLVACAPTLDDPGARVTSRRVLAVRFEPAEAAPGEALRVTALVADPRGGADPVVRWSWCDARPSLSSLAPASTRCLVDGPWQRPAGEGTTASTTMPTAACSTFGPDPPDTAQGDDARPVDPDATGGYQVPLRVVADAATSLGFARVKCNLAGVTREQSVAWARRYRTNANPVFEAIERVEGATVTAIAEGAVVAVRPGARVTLRVRWPACSGDAACGGAERYARFDPVTREIVEGREAMRVSWYTSDGDVRDVRTGRDRDDLARESDNVFTAPGAAGDVTLWVVLRDERGGVAWTTLRLRVAN